MNDTLELVILFRVVPESGQEPTPEELQRAAEFVVAQLAGEIEELADACAAADARRRVRYRAAVEPCLN